MLRGVIQRFDFSLGEFARASGRAAQPHFAFADGFARRHQRAGADERMLLDHCAVQHDRAHADERRILDGAGVDDRFVADGHIAADAGGEAAEFGVRAVMADVDDGAVLDVSARADTDEVHVAADHRRRPDRHVVAQFDIADHDRGGIDVDPFAKGGQMVEVRADQGIADGGIGIGHGRI